MVVCKDIEKGFDMRLARTKNAISNSIWGLVSKSVILLMPFVVRTIIIKVLGVEYLGLSSLFTSILSVLNLAELGIGSAIVFSIYKPIAENDDKLICALLNLYKKAYRWIGIIITAIGLCLIPFLRTLVSGNVPSDISLHVLFLIYLANTAISYWLFAYRSCLLFAHQRNDVISKISIVANLGMYLAQIGSLFLFKHYYAYIIIQPFFGILINLTNAFFSKKMYPHYFCKGSIGDALKADIKKRVQGLVMTKVAYASRNAFGSIVISAFLGLQVVAVYSNYYYISSAVSGLMLVLMNAISAGVGNSIVTDSKEKNEKDMKIINFLYMSIAGFCFCCFVSLYQPFMRLWVGEELLFSEGVMLTISVYFFLEKTLNVIGQYYDAAGLWWHGRWKGVIESFTNLVLNVVLCRLFGVFGVVIATIISILFVGLPLAYYYIYKYYFGGSFFEPLKEQFMFLIKFLLIGFLVYLVTFFVPLGTGAGYSILYMVLRLIFFSIISVAMYLLFFYKDKRFIEAKSWVRQRLYLLKSDS